MSLSPASGVPRATVVIPTFGHAPFVRCAIQSAQHQTVRELEICVILDGSPPAMRDLVEGLAREDERIRVFAFPKAPRTGEIHRAKVIPQTTGRIICYLSHDDLWLPRHVEILEQSLAEADFAHSLHLEPALAESGERVSMTLPCNLSHPEVRRRMTDPECGMNYFGLTCGAHTREAYFRLPEGWTVTPEGTPTDLFMWRKFLRAPDLRSTSVMLITALHFPAPSWTRHHSAETFEQHLDHHLSRMGDPALLDPLINQVVLRLVHQNIDQEQALAEARRLLADKDVWLADKDVRLADLDHRISELRGQLKASKQALKQHQAQLPALLEAEANRRVRELPVRKIWKLIWKRLTGQYRNP